MISLAETGILLSQAGGERVREKTAALDIGFPVDSPSGRRSGRRDLRRLRLKTHTAKKIISYLASVGFIARRCGFESRMIKMCLVRRLQQPKMVSKTICEMGSSRLDRALFLREGPDGPSGFRSPLTARRKTLKRHGVSAPLTDRSLPSAEGGHIKASTAAQKQRSTKSSR